MALAMGLSVAFPTVAADSNDCATVTAWASSYVERAPAPTLDALARFELSERIAIFNAVTPAVRSSLAREHLRRMGQSAELSDTQRALVDEAWTVATPALYSGEQSAAAAMTLLKERIIVAFPASHPSTRGWYELASVVPGALSGALGQSPKCNCNLSAGTCGCSVTDCAVRESGCGPGFAFPCDGRCQ